MGKNLQTRVNLQVQPGARRSEVVGRYGDAWKVRVASPPVDGKANEAVVTLLAQVLGIRRRDIKIIHGHTGRRKLAEVAGLSGVEIADRMSR